ncbi:hypothetical protein [Rhizobium favelukesii]|uniref:hypothetical protein n=1 Tax=Rhizobium favelukesii TaxID=348824 RepID=UPI000414C6D9|nr:hypothetical protein [Rhizobium favelukesii]MCS0463496.1 hypothetical protein [Rhizobium favelukesii]
MIGAIARLLGVDKWLVSAVGALVLAAFVFFAASTACNRIYDSGYQAAAGKFTAEIAEMKRQAVTARDAEIERQSAAQDAAKAREATRIAAMQSESESLQTQIEELQREADQDPDAGRVVLSAPSVRRINQIR